MIDYVKTKRDVVQNAKCVLEYSKVSVKIQTFFAIRKRGETDSFHRVKNCEISESRI